jgi:arylsulfatase A-like enzyme
MGVRNPKRDTKSRALAPRPPLPSGETGETLRAGQGSGFSPHPTLTRSLLNHLPNLDRHLNLTPPVRALSSSRESLPLAQIGPRDQNRYMKANTAVPTNAQVRGQQKRVFGSLLALGIFLAHACSVAALGQSASRPNVLLIISDDQGYGDLGVHDNPKIRTPHLDKFARDSVRLKSFYVSPVCAPTRASLLTGRYNFRTGVVDTYLGRAMMRPDEVTLAQMLGRAGYRTGIFGKWHLGDNAPLRPIDRGFEEALVIKGGGIGQAADQPGTNSYLNPSLQHNGNAGRYQGYCSDLFAQAAIDFMCAPGQRPFFAYLAFNCVHEPLEAPEQELSIYRAMDLDLRGFPQLGQAIPPAYATPQDSVARVYAMVTNIDTNVGKVLQALQQRGLAASTIVIFLTDNGPAKVRFNDGLRGWKGSVYDGGIRVPCYVRWPGQFPAGHVVDRIAAHIDILPTLLEACGVAAPAGVKLDGRSLLPLLRGLPATGWRDRTLYLQWHRGDQPEPGRAFAARSQTFKLLRPEPPEGARKVPPLELYDMEHDPYELHNIAAAHPEIVARMYKDYLAWFRDVSASGFAPVRIELGGTREDPTILTRQDWRGPKAGWELNDLGYWEVAVARPGIFEVNFHLPPRRFATVAHLGIGDVHRKQALAAGATQCRFVGVPLVAGPARLDAWVEGNRARAGALAVTVTRLRDGPGRNAK